MSGTRAPLFREPLFTGHVTQLWAIIVAENQSRPFAGARPDFA
jgi:hypothetical protein